MLQNQAENEKNKIKKLEKSLVNKVKKNNI